MNFSKSHYGRLKSRLKSKYRRQLKVALREVRKFPTRKLSTWLLENADELTEYSSFNWHFLHQIHMFLYFNRQPLTLGKSDFGEIEEEVFERWNHSEFADVFLKKLNQGQSLGKASEATLKIFDQHLVILAEKHILKTKKTSSHYRPQTSLGEVTRKNVTTKLLETTLHLEGKELRLMTSSLKEMKGFSQRIEIALKVIKKFSPSSWERFKAFTEVIIPIKQPELVSYSHQNLPGYSMINLYHRDFVDLMDDLLHENGHHHLNYYLNLGTLISEPLDNIYYSPWRRTLRPLRGIYHAYFTFFWAFKIFADLARTKEVDSIWYLFGPREKEKIIWRAVEEFHMLNFSFEELKWAHKKGLIRETGWKLIHAQQKELIKFKKLIPGWEKKLKEFKPELKALKETLKASAKKYKRDY